MKVNIKSLCSCLLFCLIFIVSGCFNNNVYATEDGNIVDGGIKEGYITASDNAEEDGFQLLKSSSLEPSLGVVMNLNSLAGTFKKDFAENMLEGEKDNFAFTDFLPQVTVTGSIQDVEADYNDDGTKIVGWNRVEKDYKQVCTIVDFDDSFLNKPSGEEFIIEFKYASNDSKTQYTYKFKTYSDSLYISSYYRGASEPSPENRSELSENRQKEKKSGDNTKLLFELYRGEALLGIIGGSIGAGYNVGNPYSLTQKSLADIMELKGNGYDFKNLRSIDFSFSYYFSPIFGQMYKDKEPFLPETEEEWIEYGMSRASEIVQGTSVVINPDYLTFKSEISEDTINVRGEKISDKKINGAKKIGVSGSKDPKSVISYSMPINVPYLFEISGGKGRLVTTSLREMDSYILSIYNDNIYPVSSDGQLINEEVTDLANLGINRKDVFLYNKDIPIESNLGAEEAEETEETKETENTEDGKIATPSSTSIKKGIVIIASFDECVVDTTETFDSANPENNLYLTGRKITLDNGYSDALDYKNLEGNVDLMAVRGGTDQEGAYPPRFVSFPAPGIELKGFSLYHTLGGEVEEINPEMAEKIKEVAVPMTEDESFAYINDKEMHGNLPETTSVVRYFINFGPIKTGIGYTSDTVDNSKEIGKYSLYIIRNNAYINDGLLLDWLKTSEAQAMTHVNAELLIEKITGDFTNNLGKLSYEDWLKIQEIRGEFDYYKSTWLIRTINVMSLVLGAFLIIFGILFIGLYWFDIFNTFTDFSCLQFITHGNIYPVTDKDFAPYLPDSGNTKFVTFFDVLILALIMVFAGILLINSQFIIDLIIRVFNYLSYTVGGF